MVMMVVVDKPFTPLRAYSFINCPFHPKWKKRAKVMPKTEDDLAGESVQNEHQTNLLI